MFIFCKKKWVLVLKTVGGLLQSFSTSFFTTPAPSIMICCVSLDSLGEDHAIERDVEAELVWDGVQVAHGSEVDQTVGGLLAELNTDAP